MRLGTVASTGGLQFGDHLRSAARPPPPPTDSRRSPRRPAFAPPRRPAHQPTSPPRCGSGRWGALRGGDRPVLLPGSAPPRADRSARRPGQPSPTTARPGSPRVVRSPAADSRPSRASPASNSARSAAPASPGALKVCRHLTVIADHTVGRLGQRIAATSPRVNVSAR